MIQMKFGIGDTCYIIENDEVKRARVSAKKDGLYAHSAQ